MLTQYNVDQSGNAKLLFDAFKVSVLMDAPVVIRVNKFDEPAVQLFNDSFSAAYKTGQKFVPVIIDSYGGQVYSLLSMVDTIKNSKLPVATIISGKAMSCGSILASCGTKGMRYMTPNSTMMIHDVSSMSWGKVEDLKVDVKESERLNKVIYQMLASNCDQKRDYFWDIVQEKGRTDWFLTAKDCKKHGLIDVIGTPTLKVDIKIDQTLGM